MNVAPLIDCYREVVWTSDAPSRMQQKRFIASGPPAAGITGRIEHVFARFTSAEAQLTSKRVWCGWPPTYNEP